MSSPYRLRSRLVARTSRTGPCGWLWPAASALLAMACCLVPVQGLAGWVGLVAGSAAGFVLTVAAVRGAVHWVGRPQRPVPSADNLSGVVGADGITGEVVWEVDPDGRMTYLDDRAAELFGWDAGTLIGQNIVSLLHPQEVLRARSVLAQAVAARVGWNDESFRVVHSSGEVRWIHTSGLAHVGDDGRVRGFTAVSRLFREGDVVSGNAAVGARIDRLVDHGLLRTAFQPIVCTGTGRVVGVEALSRFPAEPAQGPDQWFRDADQVGRGVELELLALERAAATAGRLPAHLYVSLNVSPATLTSTDLPALLDGLGLAPDRVVLEVTEHVGVDNYDQLQAVREQLRAVGVRLAVDDAGAGYASFRHIVRLRPDVIKLDRGIISGIDTEPAQQALAGALVAYAHEVGAVVVAEGIETADELATVSCLGVDAVQGYLLGRPTDEPGAWSRWQSTRQVPTATAALRGTVNQAALSPGR